MALFWVSLLCCLCVVVLSQSINTFPDVYNNLFKLGLQQWMTPQKAMPCYKNRGHWNEKARWEALLLWIYNHLLCFFLLWSNILIDSIVIVTVSKCLLAGFQIVTEFALFVHCFWVNMIFWSYCQKYGNKYWKTTDVVCLISNNCAKCMHLLYLFNQQKHVGIVQVYWIKLPQLKKLNC